MGGDDLELRLRDEDEATPAPPSPWRARLGRTLREIAVTLGIGAVVFVIVGALRAPELPAHAPVLALRSLEGEVVDLAQLRGQTVVVNFWATWCAPCRVELPTLTSFAAEHPDIPVLFVAADGTPAALTAFADAHDMPRARVLLADAKSRAAWPVESLPTTVVVAPDGTIAASHGGLIFGPQLWWMTR